MFVTNSKILNSIISNRRTQSYITEKKNHYQHKLNIQRKQNNLYIISE